MTLICYWCGGNEAPFTKLNIEQYGDNKFICSLCYRTLELAQKREGKMKGKIIWFYGLSGSGKTTLADLLSEKIPCQRLDGDVVRETLCRDLGFSVEDRFENIRRVAFVADLLSKHGVNVIASFITPLRAMRYYLRKVLGDRLILINIDCPLEVCMKRDPKGLYEKALNGEIVGMTGLTSVFEINDIEDIVIYTAKNNPSHCIDVIMEMLDK